MIGLTRLKLQDGVFAGPNPDVENHNRKAIRTTSVPAMQTRKSFYTGQS
jgi:hypothetical protein